MTVPEYISSGYPISGQVSDAIVERAETDVMNCYVKPIVGVDATVEDYIEEVMALSYCLLLRRSILKTRFGSEQKKSQNGERFEDSIILRQITSICMPAILSLETKSLIDVPYNDVSDIIDFGYYKL
ncbi:MAG TPA: hypothetical protein DCS17_07395 [Flavobacterium sp.]|nr:hypothetical protein [Flavobacterium sp.]